MEQQLGIPWSNNGAYHGATMEHTGAGIGNAMEHAVGHTGAGIGNAMEHAVGHTMEQQ